MPGVQPARNSLPSANRVLIRNQRSGELEPLSEFSIETQVPGRRHNPNSFLGRTLTEIEKWRDEALACADQNVSNIAIDSILHCYDHTNLSIRRGVYRALVACRDGAIVHLKKHLGEPLTPGRDAEIITLGALLRKSPLAEREETALLVQPYLQHESAPLAEAAAVALRYLHSPGSQKALLEAALHSDVSRREFLFREVAYLQDSTLLPSVLQSLGITAFTIAKDMRTAPVELSYLLNADWVSKNLADPLACALGLRFGYLDWEVFQSLQTSFFSPAEVRPLLNAIGVATLPLVSAIRQTSNRPGLLEEWWNRKLEFCNVLSTAQSRPMDNPTALVCHPPQAALIDRELLFAALRKVDLINRDAKCSAHPFDLRHHQQGPGQFFFLSAESFRGSMLPAYEAECRKLLSGLKISPEIARVLLPYMMIANAAIDTETRPEHAIQEQLIFWAKWRAIARMFSAKLPQSESAADPESLIVSLSSKQGRQLWRYGCDIDIKADDHANALLLHAKALPLWKILSDGARTALSLHAYSLYASRRGRSIEDTRVRWHRDARKLLEREWRGKAHGLSIGCEVQNSTIPAEECFGWKEFLESRNVASPVREEFKSLVEASFPPSWSPASPVLGISALLRAKFCKNLASGVTIHLSLGADFGELGKYLALGMWAMTAQGAGPAADIDSLPQAMAAVLSKGLICLHDKPAAPDETGAKPRHYTEFRVIGIRSVHDNLESMYQTVRLLFNGAHALGLAAQSFINQQGTPSLPPEETARAGIWNAYQTAMHALLSEPRFQSLELRDANWYESSGDYRFNDLVEQLQIVGILKRWYSFLEGNGSAGRLLFKKAREIFLHHAGQAQKSLSL